MSTPQAFFAYFAVAMTILSLLVVTRRNPVHSVLWMLVLFIHIAALYLFLNAEFIAAIQIIIYAGAILVLFLFVIMLLNLRKEETEKMFQKQWFE
jgi:NADH-quinone oxidoreductase subunit J